MLEYSEKARFLGTSSGNTADARAVIANQFLFSSHYEGLVRFLGRLLRPFWNRTIIVAEPNKPLTARCMFSRAQIQQVALPLGRLQAILREVFATATHRELGKITDGGSNVQARMLVMHERHAHDAQRVRCASCTSIQKSANRSFLRLVRSKKKKRFDERKRASIMSTDLFPAHSKPLH